MGPDYYRTNTDEVYMGISRAENPLWPGWPSIDVAKVIFGDSPITIIRTFENDQEMKSLVADFHLKGK
ncbi:MAG: hypothetical protein LBJ61_02430 [Deltaproteobacteria bacterium]|jgi:hypothetical protein|nr:hypothetical protein [Deltaproteobacteria bacterium]